jgi:preprotein translocase subunit YajC
MAQAGAPAAGQAPAGPAGLLGSPIVLMVLMFGIFYFLVIRPQAKKAKQHQQMLSQLKKGDDVVTTGGVIGRVTGIKDDEVTLQVQEGVRLRVLRSAVSGLQRVAAAAEPVKADKTEKPEAKPTA